MKSMCRLLTLLMILGAGCSSALAQKLAEPILLWPGGAPGATGTSDEDKPAIIPVLADVSTNTGAAILICPGGAFTTRAIDHEGVLVSKWLKDRGVNGFILRYRIRPMYSRNDWLLDAQRAVQYIRSHAKEYRVAPNRIGIIGFSAGAALAYDASLNPLPGNPEATDPIDRVSSRPDFEVLVYGASQQQRPEGSNTIYALPPTFMFCTVEDTGAVRGMSEIFRELLQAKVPVEAHFFQNGAHGVGFALGDPVLGEYPGLLLKWMTGSGFLNAKQRQPVSGVIKLDGTPLVRGVLILTPVDQPTAPPMVVYINNASTRPMAEFTVPAHQGLVEGRYRIEVRQDATRWLSNSRDPVMIRMLDLQRKGTLTDEDRKVWADYVRKRDLSPSIEGQRVYRRQRPGDKSDYIVEIRNGVENHLDLEVFSK